MKTQTILLSIIAACLLIVVIVFVAVPAFNNGQDERESTVEEIYSEIGSGLDS